MPIVARVLRTMLLEAVIVWARFVAAAGSLSPWSFWVRHVQFTSEA